MLAFVTMLVPNTPANKVISTALDKPLLSPTMFPGDACPYRGWQMLATLRPRYLHLSNRHKVCVIHPSKAATTGIVVGWQQAHIRVLPELNLSNRGNRLAAP
jgi:hypothetical protein